MMSSWKYSEFVVILDFNQNTGQTSTSVKIFSTS